MIPGKKKLHVLCSPGNTGASHLVRNMVESLKGGADLIHLIAPAFSAKALWKAAEEFMSVTGNDGASKLIIHGRSDIARAVGAAGVHLDERDLPPSLVRTVTGHDMLIGASIRRKEEMELLSAEDVDYVIYGIFTGRGLWASGASGDSSIFDGLQSLFPIPVISVCDNISSAEGILKSDVAGIAVHPHGHPGDESPESLVSGYRSLLDKWKAS